jgi:hypothetical protein
MQNNLYLLTVTSIYTFIHGMIIIPYMKGIYENSVALGTISVSEPLTETGRSSVCSVFHVIVTDVTAAKQADF